MKSNFIKTNIALGVISIGILGFTTSSSAFKSSYNANKDTTLANLGKDTSVFIQKDSTNNNTVQNDSTFKYDLENQISNLEAERELYYSKYLLLIKQDSLDFQSLAEVKSYISIYDSKIAYLTDILNGNVVIDQKDTIYINQKDTNVVVNNDLIVLEKQKQLLFDKYAQLLNQDSTDLNLISDIKNQINDINIKIDKINNPNYGKDSSWVNVYNKQDSLLVQVVQVSYLDKQKEELYQKYNQLVANNASQDSLIEVKKQIIALDSKVYNIDSSFVVDNKVDTTFWKDKIANDTVVGNKVTFTWEIENVNDKYCFQVSKDSTFKSIALEVCNLENGFVAFDNSQLLNLKSDSVNSNKRVAQVATGAYWRVGVEAGNNSTVWSTPTALDLAKLTGVEDLAVVSASIYPNPVVESFSINGVDNIESVTILNSIGSSVKSFAAQETYNLSGLNAGIYIVEVKTASTISKNRIVVK